MNEPVLRGSQEHSAEGLRIAAFMGRNAKTNTALTPDWVWVQGGAMLLTFDLKLVTEEMFQPYMSICHPSKLSPAGSLDLPRVQVAALRSCPCFFYCLLSGPQGLLLPLC